MEKESKDTQLTLEDKVRIGDIVHDCDAVICMTLKNNINDNPNKKQTQGVVKGKANDIIQMLAHQIKDDRNFERVIMEALMLSKSLEIQEKINNGDDSDETGFLKSLFGK